MMRSFQFRLSRIVFAFVAVFASVTFAPSARAAGMHGGGGGMGGFHGGGMGGGMGGMGGFHGGMSGGFHGDGHFHDDGHFHGGCCFFGFGFGGWPFWSYYGSGYYYGAPYPYYGAPYPYYPPPAVPGGYTGPATPPSGPTSFAVYFATGSDQLSTAGHDVIAQAAAADAHSNAQVAVAGFTDAVGGSASNLELSRRRAEAVRAALVAAGVPDHLIAVVWHGEAGLQVPTPDGVAEARNRRVVILVGAPPPVS